ncbi:MAG: type II toxin-antitoxin system HicB family antitoxin [Bacteroides sp.]|nr:type II toxin-antitoxin system HicB family antitoxin [Prevotella sp.]MCM1407688.1 type II toxin-antitoxin system HicB family antitoxin [Treponema brennaborense]MCM1469162.1 type II toxin-antitoxin system HicB family antitoxin [Bacteroides sp.]
MEKSVSNRNILVTQEDDFFVAKDIETNVASQGGDINSALANLKEALELYYEDSVAEEVPVKNAFLTTMEISI